MTDHPLRIFRETARISLAELAVRVGTSRQSLSRIETGNQSPSLDLAMRIERATDGAVTMQDLATPTKADAA